MTRVRLPDRRPIETREIVHNGMSFTVSMGWGEDVGEDRSGAALEVFITPRKGGSDMAAILSEMGFIVSQARRAGVPIGRLRGGMQRDDQGRPETIIGLTLDAMRDAE
jgi:hypothetical protein